jgi:hypothetical protein
MAQSMTSALTGCSSQQQTSQASSKQGQQTGQSGYMLMVSSKMLFSQDWNPSTLVSLA